MSTPEKAPAPAAPASKPSGGASAPRPAPRPPAHSSASERAGSAPTLPAAPVNVAINEAAAPGAPATVKATPISGIVSAGSSASENASENAPSEPAKPVERASSIANIAQRFAGRDPEASIEIPPPPAVTPPEDRPPDATDPYIGTTFDHRYKIEKLLGEGGMGFVYLARHKVIDKKVAVKVLRADLAKDREILDRFLQEARAASSIGNPHIVDISDFGDLPDGSTYFVMEFLEGKSLADATEEATRLPVDRVCHIGQQICDGLSAAHARGIVHRDLKPDNVYVIERGADHDFVKVLDFGIAKVTGNANTKLTKAGAVFGTPHYMSPEQAAGAPVDHRTDIYALGVMLYEMVSGELPFNADNFMGILTQHMYKAPVPIRALVPGPECPPSLEAVILKCLSKKPEARYQSMDELREDLERVKTGGVANAVSEMMARSGGFNVPADYFKQPSVIVPATPPTPQKKWGRTVWIAGTVAAVALVGIIFTVGRTSKGSTPAATAAPPVVTVVTVVAPATAAPAAPPPKKMNPVAVGATPDTASVYRDGVLVHQVPCSVEVEEGKTVTIEIRADNYETQTVTLDGTETSKVVKLSPVKGYKPPKGKAPPPTKSGGGSRNGEVRDPWGNK